MAKCQSLKNIYKPPNVWNAFLSWKFKLSHGSSLLLLLFITGIFHLNEKRRKKKFNTTKLTNFSAFFFYYILVTNFFFLFLPRGISGWLCCCCCYSYLTQSVKIYYHNESGQTSRENSWKSSKSTLVNNLLHVSYCVCPSFIMNSTSFFVVG